MSSIYTHLHRNLAIPPDYHRADAEAPPLDPVQGAIAIEKLREAGQLGPSKVDTEALMIALCDKLNKAMDRRDKANWIEPLPKYEKRNLQQLRQRRLEAYIRANPAADVPEIISAIGFGATKTTITKMRKKIKQETA
jgi:hypothetical protein